MILNASCYRSAFPDKIDSDEDLLEIYTTVIHFEDFDRTSDVVKKYNLTEKPNWIRYRDIIVELAKDDERYVTFKENSVEKYLSDRNKNYEVKYYEATSYNRNFNPSVKMQELSEEETKEKEKYYKVFVAVKGERRMKMYKTEYYENNELKKAFYKNDKHRTIKEEIYENGEIETSYFNLG